ncbi:MAG: hypothetical protein R3A47_01820 [Polyangiales bacterium]
MHEIGLAINFRSHHKHAAYVLANSDMPGFSSDEQLAMSAMMRGQRRKFSSSYFEKLRRPKPEIAMRLCALLRLSVLFNRSHEVASALTPSIKVNDRKIRLDLSAMALSEEDSPLLADLALEGYFARAGLAARVGVVDCSHDGKLFVEHFLRYNACRPSWPWGASMKTYTTSLISICILGHSRSDAVTR